MIKNEIKSARESYQIRWGKSVKEIEKILEKINNGPFFTTDYKWKIDPSGEWLELS